MRRTQLYPWNYSALWAIALLLGIGWPLVGLAVPPQPRGTRPEPTAPKVTSVQAAAAQVEQALNQDVTLRPFRLQVQSQGTVLVLQGVVNTVAERQLAVQLAQRIAPSFAIDNRIQAGSR